MSGDGHMEVAKDVVWGLRQNPIILFMVVLNAIMILGAVFFLSRLVDRLHATQLQMLEYCVGPQRRTSNDQRPTYTCYLSLSARSDLVADYMDSSPTTYPATRC